jgi:thioredoxin reductase (NADPH)
MKPCDIIIIGGGPAGVGAALQAVRTGCEILLVEQDMLGGRLNHAHWVSNFPLADPMGCSGRKITTALTKQLRTTNARLLHGRCTTMDHNGTYFIATVYGKKYMSKCVLLATGLAPKRVMVKGAREAFSKNLLHYYWDKIPGSLKGKKVAVIGGGEVALDQACSLAFEGARVTVLVRGNKVKAYPGLIKMAEGLGVKLKYGFAVDRITLNGPELSLHDPENRTVYCDYVVAAIGSAAPKTIVSSQARRRMNKGLYLAGDLVNKNYKQAAIAFGSGVKAAMAAEENMKRI